MPLPQIGAKPGAAPALQDKIDEHITGPSLPPISASEAITAADAGEPDADDANAQRVRMEQERAAQRERTAISFRYLTGGADVHMLMGESEGNGDASTAEAVGVGTKLERPGTAEATSSQAREHRALPPALLARQQLERPNTAQACPVRHSSQLPPSFGVGLPSAIRFVTPPPDVAVRDEPFTPAPVVELLDNRGRRTTLRPPPDAGSATARVTLSLEEGGDAEAETSAAGAMKEAMAMGTEASPSSPVRRCSPRLAGRRVMDVGPDGRASFIASRLRVNGTSPALRLCATCVVRQRGRRTGAPGEVVLTCTSEWFEAVDWFQSLRCLSESQVPWFMQSVLEQQPPEERPQSAVAFPQGYLMNGGPLHPALAESLSAQDTGVSSTFGVTVSQDGEDSKTDMEQMARATTPGTVAAVRASTPAPTAPISRPLRRLDALLASLGDEREVEQWLYATAFSSGGALESLETLATLEESDIKNAFVRSFGDVGASAANAKGLSGEAIAARRSQRKERGEVNAENKNPVEQALNITRLVRVIQQHFDRLEQESGAQLEAESDVEKVLIGARRKFIELGGRLDAPIPFSTQNDDAVTDGSAAENGNGKDTIASAPAAGTVVDGYLRGGDVLRIADWVFRVLHPQGVPLSLRERESMSAKLLIAVECEGSQSSGFETAARSQEPVPEGALSFPMLEAYVRKTAARIVRYRARRKVRAAQRKARRELVHKAKMKQLGRAMGGAAGAAMVAAAAGRGKRDNSEKARKARQRERRKARKEAAAERKKALDAQEVLRKQAEAEAAEKKEHQDAALKALVRVLWKIHSLKDAARRRAERARARRLLEHRAAMAAAVAALAAADATQTAMDAVYRADVALQSAQSAAAAQIAAAIAACAALDVRREAALALRAAAEADTRRAVGLAAAAAAGAATYAMARYDAADHAAGALAARIAAARAAVAGLGCVRDAELFAVQAANWADYAQKNAEMEAQRAMALASHNAALAARMAANVANVCYRRAEAAAKDAADARTNATKRMMAAAAAAALIAARAVAGMRQTLRVRLGETYKVLRRLQEEAEWRRRMALLAQEKSFQIRIKVSTWGVSNNGVLLLDVKPSVLVRDLKCRLEQMDGTPVARQRLHCCNPRRRGKSNDWMEDDQMLSTYNMKRGMTVLVDRLSSEEWDEMAIVDEACRDDDDDEHAVGLNKLVADILAIEIGPVPELD